jgi:uncharacterized protein YndB with AHSA1/START domain
VKTIHHVVDIDAELDAVWAAVTERDRLGLWWSSGIDTSAAAVGSVLHWTFAGDFNPVMEIISLTPRSSVEWKCLSGHDKWQDNTFRFELVDLGDSRTRLRFWQHYATELSDDDYGTYNFNWGYYLESLRVLCATGSGKPFHPPAS